MPNTWWLYILRCDEHRLYTGIATDPERRYHEHLNGTAKAARFTRAASSVELVYRVEIGSRSLALRAEHRVKQLSRAHKLRIVADQPPATALLSMLALTAEA